MNVTNCGLVAFDTGPGNMLLDWFVALSTDGKLSFDSGGEIAKSGSVNQSLLDELLAHPYFAMLPPKTTGRELFGVQVRFTQYYCFLCF